MREERMSKESTVYQAENVFKKLEDYGFKRLYTTHGFRLMGIVTWDNKETDESLGEKRRRIKGLKIENGVPIPPDKKLFDTFLDRKNPKSGQLDGIVVHEDSSMILMARKTFGLSDEDENFQFMPNQHTLNSVQQYIDEIDARGRRINRVLQEKEQAFLDSEHFQREAATSKEREKTNAELRNRLTRENARLQLRTGNLESHNQILRARNLRYEAQMDEVTSNAQDIGTLEGMTTDDKIIHAAQKRKEIDEAMVDIQQESNSDNEQVQYLEEQLREIKAEVKAMKDGGHLPVEQGKQEA